MESVTTRTKDPVRSWYQNTLDRAASNLHHTIAAAGLNMPVDEFINSDGQFVVRIDLPGVDPEDIEARVYQGQLVVKAKRRLAQDIERETMIRSEVAYGEIRRSLPLMSWVRNGSVEIQYENGVLELRLPTDPETCPQASVFRPRKVNVRRRSSNGRDPSEAKAGPPMSA